MASRDLKEVKEDEIDCIVNSELTNEFMEGYMKLEDGVTYLPIYYAKYAKAIKQFSVQDTDVIVASYPKTGTTWTQEMVWLIGNNCDFEGAKVILKQRFPFLEVSSLMNMENRFAVLGNKIPGYFLNSVKYVQEMPSPRFIKTHLPFSLLPEEIKNKTKSPKIIYVMRNPKDTCVSYFHHGRCMQGWKASFESFCKVFLTDKIMYGSFWRHILGYWNQRALSNLLIITYEDMKNDLPFVIRKVAAFLGKTITDEQIQKLTEHLSFRAMKDNKAVNYEDSLEVQRKNNVAQKDDSFLRSGTVGKYKEEMSPEIIEQFNVWTKEHIANTGFDREYGHIASLI